MMQSGLQPPRLRIVRAGIPAANDHAPRRTVRQTAKDIGLFAAAPFVTLAYVTLFPFIGMAMFAQAWRHRKNFG